MPVFAFGFSASVVFFVFVLVKASSGSLLHASRIRHHVNFYVHRRVDHFDTYPLFGIMLKSEERLEVTPTVVVRLSKKVVMFSYIRNSLS